MNNEYINKNYNARTFMNKKRCLEFRCKYCNQFKDAGEFIVAPHIDCKDDVCGDCFRFSKYWRETLDIHLKIKLLYM